MVRGQEQKNGHELGARAESAAFSSLGLDLKAAVSAWELLCASRWTRKLSFVRTIPDDSGMSPDHPPQDTAF